ncbi:DUF4783 domain-containing protein [Pontibacter sp. JH31]|uniref:DUF4783 domain-containing protein n=1 Tax=Pontibacter aquaedesilientis TaxID=2766980 RepID=A0ABR7XGG7_9BACT|nr:DUF4783 domain-containing protein [Pontibacter aquaedesilientis]MBD1397367.1 DUF4783 domain-containing protein [Pontibacter aquaedesilientis]
MKNFKNIAVVLFLALITTLLSVGQAAAQKDVFDGVETALRVGSAKDLARHFDSKVSLSFADEKSTDYSKTQAEFVMKNFFSKYPPTGFAYNFPTPSESVKKDKRYVIGTYTHRNGSYTVLIRVKDTGGKFLIHSIDFIKD